MSAIFKIYGSGSGSGSGYGSGYGDGYGYGDGSGSGDGYPEQDIGGPSCALAAASAREGIDGRGSIGDLIEFALGCAA